MTVFLIKYRLFNIRFFVSAQLIIIAIRQKKGAVMEKKTVKKSFLITKKWYEKIGRTY